MKLEGKANTTGNWKARSIYVATAYCVSQSDSAKPGADTAFMQQKRILLLQGKTNPKPREQWGNDLTE